MAGTLIKSLTWVGRTVLSVLFIILLVGGSIVFGKVAKIDKDHIWLVFCCILITAGISSLIGAVVTLYGLRERISAAGKELEGRIEALKDQAKKLQEDSQSFSTQSQNCTRCSQELKSYVDSLHQVLDLVLSKYGVEPQSLVPLSELVRIEGNVGEEQEIWVLTSALELEETVLKETIFNNIRKRIKYVYFLPEDETMLPERLITLFKKGLSKLKKPEEEIENYLDLYVVPRHFVYMTVLVYGATTPTPIVLVKFPQRQVGKGEKFYLSFRVPDQDADVFVKSLHQFMSEKNVCNNSRRYPIT